MADFSVFGSDSEDETEAPQQSAATLEYIKNASILSPSSSKTSTTTSSPAPPLPTPPLPPLFAAHPPTYSGPLLLVTADATIGGGRKFVAACDLPPGTLLLREQPLIPWSDDDEDATMLTRAVTHIKRLLSTLQNSSESRDILESMKHLHPVELADIPTHAISQFKSETNLPTNYELRLFFTFSCNAYDSGLYCYMSLFNHSEDPNCFKFSPDVANGIPYSEMRTTRHVKAGDQLTFSYINPREQSFKKRQQYFLTQHYFDIVHELASPSLSTVVSFDTLPPDFPKEVFASVEDALVAFEEDLQTKVKPPGAPDRLPIARGLYDACEELIEKVLPAIPNGRNVIMLRLLRLFVEVCAFILENSADGEEKEQVICNFVGYGRTLLEVLISYVGPDHVDVGRARFDVAEGITSLLSQKRGKLSGLGGFSNVVEAGKYEMVCRREYERVKKLYE